MNISVPVSLKRELKKHPETNWSRVAARAFEEHLEAEKLLAQFAEPSLSDEDVLRRALSAQHRAKVVKKTA
jgi:predicted translin family RNA/ssDNA-binding protein